MPIMRNSRMPDDWVAAAVQQAPFTKNADGNFRTCPVRLSFVHVLKPNPNKKNDDGSPSTVPSYEVTGLCPPGADAQINSVLWPEVYGLLSQKWGAARAQTAGQINGLHLPWRDQGTRISLKSQQLHNGCTPGLPSLKFTTQYQPQVVDPQWNPIVDPKRIYAGVWAVVLFNCFVFGDKPGAKKSGVSLGLQGIMLVADDDTLEGGGPDMKTAFAGVQLQPRFDAAAAFGAQGVPGGPPPMPGGPGAGFLPAPTPVSAPPPGIIPAGALPPPPGFGTAPPAGAYAAPPPAYGAPPPGYGAPPGYAAPPPAAPQVPAGMDYETAKMLGFVQ